MASHATASIRFCVGGSPRRRSEALTLADECAASNCRSQDIPIVVVNGLRGLSEELAAVFPETALTEFMMLPGQRKSLVRLQRAIEEAGANPITTSSAETTMTNSVKPSSALTREFTG